MCIRLRVPTIPRPSSRMSSDPRISSKATPFSKLAVARARQQKALPSVASRLSRWIPDRKMLRVARDDLAGFSNVELLETTFEAWPANRRSVPTDCRRAVMALGLPGDAVYESRRGALSQRFARGFWTRPGPDCAPSYSLSSRTFTFVERELGVPHRKLGTYLLARSKDGLTNQGYSGRSSTEGIRGSGNARH